MQIYTKIANLSKGYSFYPSSVIRRLLTFQSIPPARRSVKNFAPHAERMSPDYARLKGKLLLSIFKVQNSKKT
jgi:hypothetical protein